MKLKRLLSFLSLDGVDHFSFLTIKKLCKHFKK